MKRFQTRRVVSLSMVLLAAVLTYTGLVLYIAPQGRIAHWTDWHFLGLSKDQLGAIHTTCSFLFVAVGLIHTWYNWKPITNYLKNKAKQLRVFTREMVVASVLVVLFVAGTALGLPPFQQIIDIGEAVKGWWEEREGGPPYGHAEESPLGTVAKRMGWDAAGCRAVLEEAGLTLGEEGATLGEIAVANGKTAAEVFTLLESSERCTAGGQPGGGEGGGGDGQGGGVTSGTGSGLGRKTLEQYCGELGVDVDAAVARLEQEEIAADPSAKLKDIAAEAGVSPHDITAQLEAMAAPAREHQD